MATEVSLVFLGKNLMLIVHKLGVIPKGNFLRLFQVS